MFPLNASDVLSTILSCVKEQLLFLPCKGCYLMLLLFWGLCFGGIFLKAWKACGFKKKREEWCGYGHTETWHKKNWTFLLLIVI